MRTERRQLRDAFRIQPLYCDETPYGSAITGRCDDVIRDACAAIVEHRRRFGIAQTVRASRDLLSAAMTSGSLGALFEQPGHLRETCLFPPAASVRPVGLSLERARGEGVTELAVSPRLLADLACWTGEWRQGALPPQDREARVLWDALADLGALGPMQDKDCTNAGDLRLVGHATVELRAGTTRLLFDPFLLPSSPRYPPTYQPITAQCLSPDAIFITHSHPDHFDLASLLDFGADVPIFVPRVERESLLAIDMAARLRALGFRQVQALGWFEETRVGQSRVVALPFYGEQPTTGDRLHMDVRNEGNLYLVESAERRVAVAVDSGRDGAGDVRSVATEAQARYGPADVVLAGYRGFALYPIHYVFSSVARYVLFVPPEQWTVREQITNDPDDAIDVAELWGARHLIPYADGGAPWHWEMGLGPVLDGSAETGPAPVLDGIRMRRQLLDPPPESVGAAAARRSGSDVEPVASPVQATLLRPGDSLSLHGQEARVRRSPPHAWPYDAP
jgi:L-ascorbate metabolism protein UlaG (beta-lactamase superfamily)